MGYPNKVIERLTDDAARRLKEGNNRDFAIGQALNFGGYKNARDRNTVFGIIRKKLEYRKDAKKESQAKRDAINEQNLSLPFPPPPRKR